METDPYSYKKTKSGDIWTVREKCLELGRASSVENESQEVPLNHQEYLEDISEQEEIAMLA